MMMMIHFSTVLLTKPINKLPLENTINTPILAPDTSFLFLSLCPREKDCGTEAQLQAWGFTVGAKIVATCKTSSSSLLIHFVLFAFGMFKLLHPLCCSPRCASVKALSSIASVIAFYDEFKKCDVALSVVGFVESFLAVLMPLVLVGEHVKN